ncbi:hypothetical protein BCON_0052g00240 [Botryotinia convoluta]|uniref:Uncharacterized protein n=1 Tax=Botryotinia convoluta TaxID=54673 RepID=A0A4Z1IHM9_9HELO|nr:hypothetical protein BCON_0052g00240 [Botryotinia convoluta]
MSLSIRRIASGHSMFQKFQARDAPKQMMTVAMALPSSPFSEHSCLVGKECMISTPVPSDDKFQLRFLPSALPNLIIVKIMEDHLEGVPNLLPYEIVARFPLGYFLENIAVRSNGTLLVTNMIVGQIFYSTIQLIHGFNTSEAPPGDDEETGIYGSKNHAEAIIEHSKIADLFYAFSGVHGKADTWAVYSLDFRGFDPSRGAATTVVEKLANIPGAGWLHGATMIPETSTLLMAESQKCKIFAFDLQTRKVSICIEDERLGKVTTRPPWPGVL